MDVAVEDLRRTMRQEALLNRTRLAPRTFLEEYEHSAFTPDDLAGRYHENTKYVRGLMAKPRRSVAEFESAAMAYVQSAISPDYPDHELIELPAPDDPGAVTLGEAMAARRSATAFVERPVSRQAIGTLLGLACGITATIEIDHEGFDRPRSKPVRAYPSAGALYPIETYVVVQRASDLPPGRYYYVPERHGLRILDQDVSLEDLTDRAFLGAGGGDPSGASILIVLTATFWRALAKYGPRGYRYVLQESGHLAQNLLLTAAAIGLAALPVGGFYDGAVDELVGIDGANQATVYTVAIGPRPNEATTGGGE